MNSLKLFFFIIFILFSFIFIARYHMVGQGIYGDGIFYWAYTRSIVIDKNLNTSNEVSHAYSPESNNSLQVESRVLPEESISEARYFPIGTSLFWTPSFLVAHFYSQFINNFIQSKPIHGYSDTYQITVGIFNIMFVVSGIFFTLKLLKIFYKNRTALISTLLVIFATSLFYYASIDVLNSHSSAFLISSIFFYYWIKKLFKKSQSDYFILGILVGISGLIRIQDLILLLPIMLELTYLSRSAFKNKIKNKKIIIYRQIKSFLIVLLGLTIGYLPQLLVSRLVYGSFLYRPYNDASGIALSFNPEAIYGIVLNKDTGLIYYSPIILLGFIGLFFLHKKNSFLSFSAVFTITLAYVVIASWNGWKQGESYGIRMLITYYPLFALGIGAIITKFLNYVSIKIIIILTLFLILHNFIMILNFHIFKHNSTFIQGKPTQGTEIRNKIYLKLSELNYRL